MPLQQVTFIDKIEIDEFNNIGVRRATVVVRDDGTEVSPREFHRHVVSAGGDTGGEDPRVQAIAVVLWGRPGLDRATRTPIVDVSAPLASGTVVVGPGAGIVGK